LGYLEIQQTDGKVGPRGDMGSEMGIDPSGQRVLRALITERTGLALGKTVSIEK